MINVVNSSLVFSTALNTQNQNKIDNLDDKEVKQDDFSHKGATVDKSIDDDKLKNIMEETKKSFAQILNEYQKLTQDIPVRENSIYERLQNGTLETSLITEIDSFISKNSISKFADSFYELHLDKDVATLYRTVTNFDEFKVAWLELKDKRSKDLIKAVLNGYNGGVILSNDDKENIVAILKEELDGDGFSQENSQNIQAKNSLNVIQTNENQDQISKRTPIQVISKDQTYKDLNFSNIQNLLKDKHEIQLFELLFSQKTDKTNHSSQDFINFNLKQFNQMKNLNSIDIKA